MAYFLAIPSTTNSIWRRHQGRYMFPTDLGVLATTAYQGWTGINPGFDLTIVNRFLALSPR